MNLVGARLLLVLCTLAASGLAREVRAEDPKAAAHEHFDKGLTAWNDQRFGEAIGEFEKAFELWPDYRVLYNIGKVRVALGRSVEAVDAFETYLAQGGDELAQDRKQEVRDAIAAQMSHIATLDVKVSIEGAEVRIDGKLIGRSPLAGALRITEGKHTLEALSPGRTTQLRELELQGATSTEVVLTFPPPVRLEPRPAGPAPLLTASPTARRWRAVGYGLAGAGLVMTIVGAVFAYEGATDANAARARAVEAAMPLPPAAPNFGSYDTAKLAFDNAKTRNELGWALVGVGAAALVGGGTLALVWSGSSSDGIALRGSW